ncbi:MAG: COX15/CtaA family protein [Acidobacteriota bacterium]|nr:COX15/CtaA family protein [Acidobacteriota bacterium]
MFHRLSSFQRLALWTTAITYFLILVGGLVRASGAGLGCPDWPRCFGGWIPPLSAADLPPQFDASQFNPTLMWTEYLNRLLGMAVGFLILATVVSAWRHHRREPRILWTAIAALLLTGFQGWLGGRVVAHELAAWIVTIHMIVALVIVQMLLYVTVVAQDKPKGLSPQQGLSPQPSGGDKPLRGDKPLGLSISVLIVITLIQIALGTQVRGGVDAALDAGTARADALATVGWLDYAHRDAAMAVLLGAVLLTAWLVSRHSPLVRWSYAVLTLAALQVAVGVVMAYGSLLLAAQVLHLTIASLLLGAETVLFLLSWRQTT